MEGGGGRGRGGLHAKVTCGFSRVVPGTRRSRHIVRGGNSAAVVVVTVHR